MYIELRIVVNAVYSLQSHCRPFLTIEFVTASGVGLRRMIPAVPENMFLMPRPCGPTHAEQISRTSRAPSDAYVARFEMPCHTCLLLGRARDNHEQNGNKTRTVATRCHDCDPKWSPGVYRLNGTTASGRRRRNTRTRASAARAHVRVSGTGNEKPLLSAQRARNSIFRNAFGKPWRTAVRSLRIQDAI